MFAETDFTRHPERSEAESNFFRLRSQTSLRSVCSSLRSEFDCAQDDVDEKSAERSKAGSTNNQRTMFALTQPKSFRPPFSKGGRFSGRRPEAHSAECETPSIVQKTQERVNFFAKQRKRENPRRGFSFYS